MRNSTIIVKKKRLGCGHFDYAFSKNRCKQCATIEDTQKRMEKAGLVDSDDAESFQNLVDDLDQVFSQYIRLRDSDENGIATCFTCGAKAPYKEHQNGHFIPRRHLATRWHEQNCQDQCPGCNEFKAGNLDAFEKNLEILQPGLPDMLRELSNEVTKPTRDELKQLIMNYRLKVRNMEKKLKQPKP
jgi:hypothetical protein